MAFMNWTDELSVGVPEIDDDHKKLVALLNDLHQAVEQGQGHRVLEQTLSGLVLYVSYHFSHEEGLYIRAQYPDYENHKKQHDALTEQVMEIQSQFRTKSNEGLSRDVLEFLKGWLYHHILEADKKFTMYMNAYSIEI